MSLDNEFIVALFNQKGTKPFRQAVLSVDPSWITMADDRVVFEGVCELDAQGRDVSVGNLLSVVAFKDYQVDGLEGLLAEGEGADADLCRLSQALKERDAHKKAVAIMRPLMEAPTARAGDLVTAAREIALLGATLDSKRLEVRTVLESAMAVAEGQPLVPVAACKNLVTFGIQALDGDLRCGPGSLGVIAAITGAGKTTMAIQAAVKSARQGKRALIVSLEMSHEEIHAKTIGHLLKIDSFKILSNENYLKILPEHQDILDRISSICPGSGQNWNQLEAYIRNIHEKDPFQIVIVDYFTLLEPPDTKRGANSAQLYGEISKSAKRLAQDLLISVVLVAQFNRNVEEYEEPRLKDLRETGQLENDANWAILLWNTRDEVNGNPIVKGRIAKNRGGKGGTLFHLEVDRVTGNFYECRI